MKHDRNQTAELPLNVHEIREKLSLATEKWRESGMMLCELRKDVARFLVLRTAWEKGAGRKRKKKNLLSPEAAERSGGIGSPAGGPPSRELRRIFVRVNHLMNLPIAKDRMAASSLLPPSLDAQPCVTCGLPLPRGRKKFCSEECRKNAARGARPSSGEAKAELSANLLPHEPEGEPGPEPGFGRRNMECDFYEACLDLAILEDWEGFCCESCSLKGPQEQLTLSQEL